MQAAHLSFGEGILVCPTNAGAVLGVDLLSHSLVWAHPYREKTQATAVDTEMMIRRGFGQPMITQQTIMASATDWKVSAPVIQDGKVVFTAPDANSVHCLNVSDGSQLWKVGKAEDDLFMGGVFNGKVLIVGKKTCRALSLKDGSVVWTVDTGMPSGQGIAGDNVYYLPLKSAAKTKEPEVCAIDIDKGMVEAHTKSRKKADGTMVVPGNLLFYDGFVASQTVDEVAAYPQLKTILAQSDELIKKNPKDPVGLALRGELRLDKGDLNGAVDDLRAALANNPPADLLPRTRGQLFECMTELLHRDFNAAEKYLDEYQALCRVEVAPPMTNQERLLAAAEQQQREINRLIMLGKGREQQGKVVDALHVYKELANIDTKEELVSVLDEPGLKVALKVYAQGRIAALFAKATPEQRKQLEEEVGRQWKEMK